MLERFGLGCMFNQLPAFEFSTASQSSATRNQG